MCRVKTMFFSFLKTLHSHKANSNFAKIIIIELLSSFLAWFLMVQEDLFVSETKQTNKRSK